MGRFYKDPDEPEDKEYWDEMDRKAREELGWDDDDDDEMPLCCQTCGNRDHYPDCTDSCSLFDD